MNSLLQAPITHHQFANWPRAHGRLVAVLRLASLRGQSPRSS